MTPAEIIQAAIDKLERLRDRSTQDPWVRDVATAEADPELMRAVVFDDLNDEDAALVLTLHASIDAQLGLLRQARDWRLMLLADGVTVAEVGEPAVVALARAILGDDA